MDRSEREIGLRGFLNKITPQEKTKLQKQDTDILYKMIGFVEASDFVDNGAIITNIGYLCGEKEINTCIVDFKVFYPTLYNYLDVEHNEKGKGLLTVLRDDKVDIRENINVTKYKQLYLLSPSPYDLIEEYLDFKMSTIKRLLEELKEMFDLVLIDIPNNPPLEFCLAAMKYVHRGFITVSERIESIDNVIKLLEFSSSVGISTAKFTNLIYANLLDLNYDYGALKETNLKVVAKIPMVRAVTEGYLKGDLYIKDSAIIDKRYMKGIQDVVNIITT